MKDIETEKEMVMASNRSLAEFNLGKEPALNIKKQEIQKLSEEGEQRFNSIEAKSKGMCKFNLNELKCIFINCKYQSFWKFQYSNELITYLAY